jgi:hypothetical protein
MREKMRLFASMAMFLAPLAPAMGGEHFVTPGGAGDRSGHDWANAQPAKQLQATLDAVAAGDIVRLGSGAYGGITFKLTTGGEVGKPVEIVGVDTGGGLPAFKSTFDRANPAKSGKVFLAISEGVSNVTVRGLRLEAYRQAVHLDGKHQSIRMEDVDVAGTRDAFWIDGGATVAEPQSGSKGLSFVGCDVVGFTKRGFRVENGNSGVTFDHCTADAGGKDWATEPFHMGFQCIGGEKGVMDRDITFTDCVAKNSYYDKGKGYWNGDGFCAEDSVENITFIRCGSFDNTDGGWDIKAKNPKLIGCVSIGNKRNFRLWTSTNGTALMQNCLSAYSIDRSHSNRPNIGLWVKAGGTLTVEHCTFWENHTSIQVDDGSAEKPTHVTLDHVVGKTTEGGTSQALSAGVEVKEIGSVWAPKIDVKLKQPAPTWRSGDDAFDCMSNPDAGYRFNAK